MHLLSCESQTQSCYVQRLLFAQISLRETYKGTKKTGPSNFTRKAPVVAPAHLEPSNNAHNNVPHRLAATATVANTTATPAAAAAAVGSSASDRTIATANWPQVCQLCVSVYCNIRGLYSCVTFFLIFLIFEWWDAVWDEMLICIWSS